MKHLYFTFTLLLISIYSFADDTEIYGTAGNTNLNQAKPNVLFIMDTSGSMSANVINRPVYDNKTEYTGSYSSDRIYSGLDQNTWEGHAESTLEYSDSVNCDPVIATLESDGKVSGNFEQYRSNNWRTSLKNGNNNKIRCDGEKESSTFLYSANYMNWYVNSGTDSGKDRLETVVDVVKNITESISDVNMGLMRFDTITSWESGDSAYAGGMVDVAISDITSSKDLIRNKLDAYTHNGGTPLTEVMYEAGRYFRGETPEYGDSSYPNNSVTNSKTGSSYKSPITAQCQKNHIILFTDGEPSVDGQSDDTIHDLIQDMDFSAVPELDKDCRDNVDEDGDKLHGACLDELAYWLNQTDHSDGFSETQPIVTYTIGGFDLDSASQLLNSTAVHGGGSFYQANNTDGLTEVLTEIFTEILAVDTTFTAPAVSVNAFNASEHRDDLFYALFRPENKVKWGGNLKRYKLQDGTVKAYAYNGSTSVKTLSDAIDPDTGYFVIDSFDLWNTSNAPDGKNVTNGGMAKVIPDTDSRAIYSNDSSDDMDSFDNVASATSFGMSTSSFESTKIKNWVKGVDTKDEDVDGDSLDSRYSIGDPLHSEPVIVTYGGTDEEPDSSIFFGTNEGFIHAVDTESGVEQFSFLPYELHEIQESYYTNTAAVADKPYGMDGPITTWLKDINDNKVLYNSNGALDAGEHVYLYAGMRRGGRSYYGLNVTDRSNPEMLFRITGGETDGFDQLGQTWSKMTVSKVMWGGSSKIVLFFTGGYDTNQDSNDTREDDTIGNAIYMVDASDGTLLWSASKAGASLNIPDMKNSIPASISAVDITGDGNVNYFFAVDTGGRVFRIDINQGNTNASNFASAEILAQVGDNSEAGNRRFYNKPNISLVKDRQLGDYLTIAIGSGYRAHPLNTATQDRFYMIKDRIPYPLDDSNYTCEADTGLDTDCARVKIEEAPSTKVSAAENEDINTNLLYNASSAASSGDLAGLTPLLTYGAGWYIDMNDSEKVLSEALTFSGAIIFTTFSPVLTDNSSANTCGANTGTSRVYALDQKWGLPILDLDGDGTTEASSTLTHSGIAPRPVVIYGAGGTKTIAIGTEVIDDERFDENTPDCKINGTCPDDEPSQCEEGNCYVTPVYWRQTTNE